MSKINTIAKLGVALALCATAATAGTRDIHKHGDFFQNVKAEHVQPLLGGTAFVSHVDYENMGNTSSGGTLSIAWYDTNGNRYLCQGYPQKGISYSWGSRGFGGIVRESKYLRARHPLVQFKNKGKMTGREMIRYDAATASFTNYWYQNYRWWEMRTGHLQSELPAVTWELCPDFPSAKSLGARVNKKQTAKFYNDLVRQSPGKRVKKPQYESKVPLNVPLDLDFKPMTSDGDR